MDYSSSPLDAGAGISGLTLTSVDAGYLRTAGKWGRFLSITGMVLIALAILFLLLFGGTFMAAGMGAGLDGGGAAMAGMGTFFIVIYGIVFAISLYLYYLLYQFSTNAITAADTMNGPAMTTAFQSLARMLKISGILLLIYLGFLALSILLAIIGGAAAFI